MTAPVDTRLDALVEQLRADGTLPDDWRDSLLRVPRQSFIPDVIWLWDDRGDLAAVSRHDESGTWQDQIYRDEPIITQVDDGATAPGQRGAIPSSSGSMPTMVVSMLDALDVRDGQRVLEIGTGTGYNAALLSHRVGGENVVTVEIDTALADRASDALHAAGHHPCVVVGDGTDGYPPAAPYDRLIATCAVQRIPYSWVAQTHPGGVIVTPWETAYGNGVLMRLTTAQDGTATGRIVGDSAFMWLRAQRLSNTRWAPRDTFSHGHQPETSTTSIDPDDIFHSTDADFLVGAAVPDCQVRVCDADDDSGEYTVWLYDPESRSGASVDYEPDAAAYAVEQAGPRRLWDEIETVYRQWVELGRPERERFGLTVTPDRQYVWLDEPDRSYSTKSMVG